MSDNAEIDELGPIDWVLIEFDRPFSGEAAPPLLDLVDRGLIRILDLLILRKDADGVVSVVDISQLPQEEVPHVEVFVGAASGLLGESDVAAAGEALENDTRAIFLVYENRWAAPLAAALRRAGGRLVDNGRIPVQELIAAVEELDAADAAS